MYNIIKNGAHAQYGTIDLVADKIEDVTKAPNNLAPGSKIFCIENSVTYILTPSRAWAEYTSGSSGGGGGGSSSLPAAEGRLF